MQASTAILASSLLLALTSCASAETTDPTVATPTSPAAISEVPEPEPLPLTAHAVSRLVGWTPDGPPQQGSLKSFARSHREKVSELTEKGVIAGVTVMFQPEGKAKANAMSTVEVFASDEEAQAEAARLFTVNSEPEPNSNASPLKVPGIPNAQAVQITGAFRGQPFTKVEIVYVQGAVLHELFAIGVDPVVVVPAFTDAALEAYERTAGHPLR